MSDPFKHHCEFPRGRAAMGGKDFFRRETFPDFEKENIEGSIPERFEKIVRLYPDRLAIKMGERSLTYDQLNRYSNRIARAILEKRGPGSEPIALLFEHGIDIIAAILGVLKAGKFYVAIDPSFPNTRVNLIVEDSQAKLIVTNKPNYMHARHFTDVSGALLNIDQIDSSGDDNLETSIGPESIASIMYTSGSTGTPRGVVDTHSNVLESSRYLAEMIHLVVDDRLSLLHKFTYASARTSAFMSLLNGASLFPFDFQMGDAEHLAVWVNSEGLTILYCPIAFFRQFANLSIEAIPLPSLRILHLSGAPITQSDFELYTKRFHDGVGLEISMGSTEARGIGIAVLNKQFSFPIEGTPVGYAPPGKEVLILDENHRALSTGEVGQIAVRGKNLSPGYWKQPNITTAKFLPDPDGGDERIYLTGDLGKMLPDGFLVHMGRKDLMVKIRGYRVDISEVERALLEHPGVKEAGVASWDREPGEKYLAGYIVPRQESGVDVSEVREFLSKKLPDYMVPSTFMFMESLPLTNGKLDRRALPKPDHRRPELKEPYVAPRNDIETKLSRIWGEALVVDQVGIRDNFFDLGGHSLAGAAIIARINEEFGIELPINRLLDSPTVTELSRALSLERIDRADLEPVKEARITETPLTPGVRSPNSFGGFSEGEVEGSIPERFEKIVQLYPDRLAVKMGKRFLTYDELNRYANRIARAILDKRGPGGEPIALLFEHGIDVIAAIFGILKAGKFYVVLDPSSPPGRTHYLIKDSGSKLVVTNRLNLNAALKLTDENQAVLTTDINDETHSPDNLSINISPEERVCIRYTSGSTGTPKGVVELHRNVLQSICSLAAETHVSPADRFTLLHSLTFASGHLNLRLALLNGASLLGFDIKRENIERLATWLKDEHITFFHSPPSLFRQLAESLPDGGIHPDLRLIRLSGAPITKRDFELYKSRFGFKTLLRIAMGSSEGRGICAAILNQDFSYPTEGFPIGYPRPGKKLLLLDEDGNEVAPGQVGEIAVKGKNLSPGYWSQPNVTAARFLPDPDGRDQRIYLTGDLGKMLPDGFLVHMGRKDLMVKIRGYRVDISEVERALLEHPGVKEAGVASWDREPGEKYLAGYIVPRRESGLDVSEVREFLSKKLPDYMVPSTFMFMESLPLTNGKLDRLALPKPDHRRPELKEPYVAPRNDLEKKLSRMWGEVLVIDQVGIDDNFFDLGGHSLAGAAIIARINEEFGIELPINRLLDSPTVTELSAIVSRQGSTEAKLQPLEKANEVYIAPVLNVQPTNNFSGFSEEEVERSIPERFEKIVRLYSDRIAVKDKERSLTYDQLNRTANRIARAIIANRGEGSEPIALFFEHGIDVLATILGVLKAGKFYVALDPSFPKERIDYILEDSGARLLVTNQYKSDFANRFVKDGCSTLDIDEINENQVSDNLGLAISATDFVRINYTSGSTGKPKGVPKEQLKSLRRAMMDTLEIPVYPEDRMTLLHTVGFGSASVCLYQSLLNGASLFPFNYKLEGVDRLASWIKEEQITILHSPPAVFRQLAELHAKQQLAESLRLIRLSGSATTRLDFELYRKNFPHKTSLEVHMGSTETGTIARAILDHGFEFPNEGVPVGYPTHGATIFLVDENNHQVAYGDVGEIAVKGRHLNPGYWKSSNLSGNNYVSDLHSDDEQIYRTGDLGRMLPDGFLIHLGRKDLMVKIRGYRVDISEVERALLEHPGVKEAGVASWDREPGEKYLTGYIVPRQESGLDVSEVREFLSKKLPDYMVPSTFMFMESLPLTNGKLDRLALPRPDNARPKLAVTYVAPRTPIEQKLAAMWAEILSVEQAGIYDNFFDLGGHSLSGARLVSLIHEEFHIDLPVSEFFAEPTIAQLAQRIEAAGKARPAAGKKVWTYLCELQRGNHHKPVFVFPGGGGGEPEFFVYGFLARHVGTEYPVHGLRARGADGVLQPHATVTQMADAYVEEIRAMQPEGPYFLVGECAGGVTAYEAARQLLSQGQEVAMLVLMDVERPTLIKYLAFRKSRWLEPVRQFCDDTVCKWWRENYYLARLPHHLRQLRSLALREYPSYVTGRIAHTLKPPEKKPRLIDSRRERAEIVLYATASGDALRHIEWVRESYRRTVRRFHPQPYNGPIEIIVSEKLYRRDPTLGWKELAPKGLRIHPVPGNHWSYIRDHVDVVGLKLRECLERAERHAAS